MTLASWFSSMRRNQRRIKSTGARRNRSRTFNRRASFEPLEDRRLLSTTVNFASESEVVDERAGTFSIPVTLSSPPSGAPIVTPLPTTFDQPAALASDSAGNLFVADYGADKVYKVPAGGGTPTTFASGLDEPDGLAFDSAGNLWVASFGADTVSELSPAGSTIATISDSHFDDPDGLAFDSAGNLYVANVGDGTVTKVPAGGGTSTIVASLFSELAGLAFDSAGNLWVASYGADTVSELSPAGATIATLSGFSAPIGLAFDSAGNLYVANSAANTVSEAPAGGGAPTTFATGFSRPFGLTMNEGKLYVGNFDNGTVSKVTQSLAVPFTISGSAFSGVDYSGLSASPLAFGIGQTTLDITGKLLSDPGPAPTLTLTLGTPTGGAIVGLTSVNTLTIAEPAAVQFGTAGETVNESAGTFSIPVTVAGAFSGARFSSGFDDPVALAADAAGNFYVADAGDGTVIEVAPNGDGVPIDSVLAAPSGLAVDAAGNVYVADQGAGKVYKVPAGGGSPTTFASGFNSPTGLAFDSAGNLYVANYDANTVIEVPAGGGSFITFASGLDEPASLAFDPAGNLYVANLGDGIVSKVAKAGGTPSTFASGFDKPVGLAFDSAGNLYVANFAANTVDEVTPKGVVSIFATGFAGPAGLAIFAGRMYVTNSENDTMSEVTETLAVPFTLAGSAASGVAYSGLTASPLTFGLGQTTEDITGKLLADPGSNQTMTFTLGTPTGGAVLRSPSKNTLTLIEPPTVQFKTGSETINEAEGTFSIPVTLLGAVDSNVTVPFTLAGDAASGIAYSGLTASPLTFPMGQTTEDVTGKLLADPGPDLTMTFTLGAPTGGAVLGSPSKNTLTLIEPPTVQFKTGSETVNEADGTFSIPVTLSGAADSKVTVPFSLAGDAESGVVYSGLTGSPLTFPMGQTTEDITGKLLSDPGPNRTLTFTLGTPAGAQSWAVPQATR